MKRTPLYILAAALLASVTAMVFAQVNNPGLTLDQVQAAMPQPAQVIPQTEAVGGAVGSTTSYMRADAKIPRITRAATLTTAGDGTFSATWAQALAAPPTVSLTWVNTGASPVTCELTAAPTATAVQGKCKGAQTSLLNLSIITAGLTLNPFNSGAAGISVHVVAIPSTQ